jgi:hypothetical protein
MTTEPEIQQPLWGKQRKPLLEWIRTYTADAPLSTPIGDLVAEMEDDLPRYYQRQLLRRSLADSLRQVRRADGATALSPAPEVDKAGMRWMKPEQMTLLDAFDMWRLAQRRSGQIQSRARGRIEEFLVMHPEIGLTADDVIRLAEEEVA